MKKWGKRYCIYISLVCMFFIIYGYINTILKTKYQTEIHFLELPIGDCTFIKTSKENIFIGEAGEKDSRYILKYLTSQETDTITKLILSFPKEECVSGFIPLLEKIKIKEIYFSQTVNLDSTTKEFLKLAKEKNISVYQINEKEKWKTDDLTFLFLRPSQHATIPETEKKTIIKLNSYKTSILWLPPMEEMDKNDLLLNSKELKADVLKVSGEKKSIVLTKDFLNSVNPKTILFSDRGKVKEEELRQIYKWNPATELLSISQEGNIIFYKKGEKYYITSKRMMNTRIQ